MGVLPSLVFAGIAVVLWWSRAPAAYPDLNQLIQQAKSVGAEGAVLLSSVVLGSALLIQPLQFELVQFFEGYWRTSWLPVRLLTAVCIAWQSRGRKALVETWEPPAGRNQGTAEDIMRAAWRLRHRYPDRQPVLPTRLGNVLRAAEERAGQRYGLDAVVVWPRLYPLLPQQVTRGLAEQRGQLDLNVRLSAMLSLSAVAQSGLFLSQPTQLLVHPWWLLLPAGTLLVAHLSYRAAVSAAEAFGVTIETVFDLHRFALFPALRLKLPATYAEEVAQNRYLTAFLRGAVHANTSRWTFDYQHEPQRKRAASKRARTVQQLEP